MDFLNLNTEFTSRQEYVNHAMTTMENFYTFYKTLHENLNQFTLTTYSALQIIYNDLMQYDNQSTFSKNFFEFYRTFGKFLSKTKQMTEKIKYELVDPTELMQKHLKDKNTTVLTELKELINNTNEQKRLHDNLKHTYFDSCRKAEEQEAEVLKSLDDQDHLKGTESQVSKQHDKLVQLRTLAEDNCQKYKTILKITNEVYEKNESLYMPIVNKLKENEESRRNFLKYHFEKIQLFILDINKSFQISTIPSIENTVDITIVVENDLNEYNERFSYCNKKNERIIKEDFLQYDIYRRNLLSIVNSNNQLFKTMPVLETVPKLSELINQKQIDLKTYSFDKKEELFITSLFDESDIDPKDIILFENKLQTNYKFAKDVIDKLLEKFQINIQIQIYNEHKLVVLANVLHSIMTNDKVNKDLFDLNFAIIYISEKAFWIESEMNKVYLCKILTDVYSYCKSKEYWNKLITLKIETELKNKAQAIIKKREQSKKKKKNTLKAIGSFFYSSSPSKDEYQLLYNEVQSKELFIILQEFIIHFSNFSVNINDANDILQEIGTDKLLGCQLCLLVSHINCNIYTIKTKRYDHYSSIEHNQVSLPFNPTRNETNFMKKKSFMDESDKQYGIIMNTLKYIPHKEYINILLLNHSFKKLTSKHIYQSLLLDNISLNFNHRISIWKNVVGYNTVKTLKDLKEVSSKVSQEIIETIQLDVVRTSYDNDQIENRKKTYNILIALSSIYQEVNYCQGMNYICCFLISLINDEEKSFDLYNAILGNTQYGELMKNEFQLLKSYFYVFDRLLAIFIPEISYHLKKNAISAGFYIAPWFITLFTNCFCCLPQGQTPKIIIRIFDLFFLSGWNAIINVSLCLVKYYENVIIKMKYEELLNFLINDIIKFDFFHVNNYDKFMSFYYKMKVSSDLIHSLENEYLLDNKIKIEEETIEKIRMERKSLTNI